MPISINPRVSAVKESATLAINQQVKKLRAEGEAVYHFGFGQSPFSVPELVQQALIQNADKNTYLPMSGLPELCEAVSSFYQRECGCACDMADIFIGPGSKEMIFQLLYALEGPLLLPAPSWVSYGPQAEVMGKPVIPILTNRDNGYRLQADELDRACDSLGDGQKVLILNNPSNPTGGLHRVEELKALAEICRTHQVIVISDEIYGLINFSGRSHTSIAHFYPEGTIVTGGLSKAFSAGGYRLGVMLVPSSLDELKPALKAMISETYSAVSAPIQYAAIPAFEFGTAIREQVEKQTRIHAATGQYLHERFIGIKLNCPRPEGGFYLFPDFDFYKDALGKRGISTSRQLTQALLQEAHVAMLPGSDFYMPDTHLGVRVASVDYDGEQVMAQFDDERKFERLFPNLVGGCDALEAFLARLNA